MTNLAARAGGMSKYGIYTASKTVHAPLWKQWRREGLPVISTWIDEAGVGETADFADLWTRCISETAKAEILVCYREEGEVLKGAFIEIGAALQSGTRVICVGDFSGMSFLHHPLVEQMNMALVRQVLFPTPALPGQIRRKDDGRSY